MNHFLTISDNKFVPQLSVLLLSLLQTNSDKEFSIFVLTDSISAENQKKVNDLVTRCGSKITFLNVDHKTFARFPSCGHISQYSYYRLIADSLLPAEVKHILYMDADIVINGSIDEWLKPSSSPLVAVKDYTSSHSSKRLGITGDYFNAGVLQINLQYFRQNYMSEKLTQLVSDMTDQVVYADQDILNVAFANQWKRLPVEHNFLSYLYKNELKFKKYYADEKLNPNNLTDIRVIHYAGYRKPWRYATDPLKNEFFRVLRQTPFRTLEPLYRLTGIYRSSGSYVKNNVLRW